MNNRSAFFKLLKRNLLILAAGVCGCALVIGVTFGLSELAARLSPEPQLLYAADEDSGETGFLKIYAWELYRDENDTREHIRLTEMTPGEPLRVGDIKFAHNINNFVTDNPAEIYSYFGFPYDLTLGLSEVRIVFAAEADAELEAYSSAGTYMEYAVPKDVLLAPLISKYNCGKGWYHDINQALNSSADSLSMEIGEVAEGRYEMIFSANAYHRITKNTNSLPERGLRNGEWDAEARTNSYMQYLGEVYPGIPSPYCLLGREVSESAILVSAYDKSRPGRLLAQAELRITNYSSWGSGKSGLGWLYTDQIDKILYEHGLCSPDNYGYTEAVLIDYWQLDGLE